MKANSIKNIFKLILKSKTQHNSLQQPTKTLMSKLLFTTFLLGIPTLAWAMTGNANKVDFTDTTFAMIALFVFILAYSMVIAEEFLHMRKSKPVMLAAGIIWVLVGMAYLAQGDTSTPSAILKHNLLEFAELLLFLLAAMTYINTMEERRIFEKLRSKLVSSGFSLRTIFWLTGLLAFIMSPIADNLTTALVMAAVVIAVGANNHKFVSVACVNIVVAANAGGAFSPFGDITTLMVWQKGIVEFTQFFDLIIPSLVNWLIPALLMSLVISKSKPDAMTETVNIKQGGIVIIFLFLGTIATAVSFHNFLHLPPAVGMMTGLAVLKIFSYFIRRDDISKSAMQINGPEKARSILQEEPFDIFEQLRRAEWDTLMFFYGVILCVGGLGALGYMTLVSEYLYVDLGATWANISVGVISAIVDNIPVMFAVLTMSPDMSLGQWLLVTLTAGVGGSLLSIGSAAGVALMGQARGVYTFFSHLKWAWAIALGYIASIWVHLWINADLM